MTRTDKTLLYIILATALPITIAMLIWASPRDRAIRNQTKVVDLLARAHADLTSATSQIEHVTLGDGTMLVPERNEIVAGYVLRAHVQSSSFTIKALPVKVGETGLFSYFRDEAGTIRFEIDGKGASAESRQLGEIPSGPSR